MAELTHDLIIVGAGPGGYTAAIRAAQLGMRVAIIDKRAELGGTCLNVGCIPAKALLESSALYAQARKDLAAHGIAAKDVELDLSVLMARKASVVSALTKGVAALMAKNGVETFSGTARLAAADTVEVTATSQLADPSPDPAATGPGDPAATRSLCAERVIVATGSRPAELAAAPFDGERIISSTEALALSEVPARMLVVGAGAIGLEMASIWSRLGAQVTVTELMDQILPGADARSATLLQRSLKRQGIEFRLGAVLQSTRRTRAAGGADTVEATITHKGKEIATEFDLVLVAVGRRPCTQGLGLEAIGVESDQHGRIKVDADYRSGVAGVYAIGDVIAGPMLAHKAEEEAVACVERMAGLPGHVNYAAIPSVVYTEPELATVGLSQQQAGEAGHETRVGTFPFLANGRARCAGHTDGAATMVVDAASDRILGVHIVGHHASELIAEASLAIHLGARADDLARAVHAHPTLSEAVKEAALAAGGRALNT